MKPGVGMRPRAAVLRGAVFLFYFKSLFIILCGERVNMVENTCV
jgi:hypothetical protein